MNSDRARHMGQSLFFVAAFLLCASLVKPVQGRLESITGDPGQEPDVLYFSSPKVVKKMALSYDRVLADIYWMRTIQYYGRRDEADRRQIRYKNLPVLLDITTTLDPGLLDAYRTGSLFLSEPEPVGAGKPEEGLKLLDKGIQAHPRDWRLWNDKGFIYYWFLNDYQKAGETWRAGSRLEGAPAWMEPLAAMSFTKGGAVEVGMALWEAQYRESPRADVRENARNHLISIEVARDIWTLEYLIEKYREKNGALPAALAELVTGGNSGVKTVDPLGTPYSYNPVTGAVSLDPESKVKYLHVPFTYKEQFLSKIETQ